MVALADHVVNELPKLPLRTPTSQPLNHLLENLLGNIFNRHLAKRRQNSRPAIEQLNGLGRLLLGGHDDGWPTLSQIEHRVDGGEKDNSPVLDVYQFLQQLQLSPIDLCIVDTKLEVIQ